MFQCPERAGLIPARRFKNWLSTSTRIGAAVSALAWAVSWPLAAQAASVRPLLERPTQIETRVVEVDAHTGVTAVLVVLAAGDGRLFMDLGDLVSLGLAPLALAQLPQTPLEGCERCVDLSEIGSFREDTDQARFELLPKLPFLPARAYSFDRGRSSRQDGSAYRGSAGFSMNYDVLASQLVAESGLELRTLGFINQATLSLGEIGILRSGAFVFQQGSNAPRALLADSYYERQLQADGATIRIGDSRTPGDGFIGASRVAGFHWRSNRELRPEIYSNPYYALSFQARAPGVVEIYRDGVLSGRQDIDAGTITLDDLPASRRGDVRLVVRNVLGEEEVIYARLFNDPTLLPQGRVETSLSFGRLHDVDRLGERVVAAQQAYGLLPWLSAVATAEIGEDRVENGVALRAGSPIGRFQLGASHSALPGLRTFISRGDWRNDFRYAGANWVTGASYFQFHQPTALTGFNAFTSVSRKELGAELSVLGFGDAIGGSFGLGWGRGAFSVGGLVSAFVGESVQIGLRASWSPRVGGSTTRFGSTALGDSAAGVSRLVANAGIVAAPYSADLFTAYLPQARDEKASWQLRGGYDGSRLRAVVDTAQVGDSSRHTLRASGALVADDDGLFFTGTIPANAGYAVVDTGTDGAVVGSSGREYSVGSSGKVALPIAAYREFRPKITLPELIDGMGVAEVVEGGRVMPGQKLRVKAGARYGVLLLLPRESARVSVNGLPAPTVGFYAQLDDLRLGSNRVSVDGQAYEFLVPGPVFGVFRLDASNQQIVEETLQ